MNISRAFFFSFLIFKKKIQCTFFFNSKQHMLKRKDSQGDKKAKMDTPSKYVCLCIFLVKAVFIYFAMGV